MNETIVRYKFCPDCDYRLDYCADVDLYQCPECHRFYEVME